MKSFNSTEEPLFSNLNNKGAIFTSLLEKKDFD